MKNNQFKGNTYKVHRGLYFKASRDTFGTTLYMLSGDDKLVQNQLQHRKREQTDKYVLWNWLKIDSD